MFQEGFISHPLQITKLFLVQATSGPFESETILFWSTFHESAQLIYNLPFFLQNFKAILQSYFCKDRTILDNLILLMKSPTYLYSWEGLRNAAGPGTNNWKLSANRRNWKVVWNKQHFATLADFLHFQSWYLIKDKVGIVRQPTEQ